MAAYDGTEFEDAVLRSSPADQMKWPDYFAALALGGLFFGLATLWSMPGLAPEAWEDLAVAAKLRPAAAIAPGLWTALVESVLKVLPLSTVMDFLPLVGRVVMGVTVALTYLLFRSMLSVAVRLRLRFSRRRYAVVRVSAAFGALFFACSDPIWRAGQVFSPTTLLTFLAVFSLYLFFSFVQGGSLLKVYGCMFLMGALAAETPIGLVLVVFAWSVYFMASRRVVAQDVPLFNPVVSQLAKWHMTFLFFLALCGAVVLNCATFRWDAGVAAAGAQAGDLPSLYVLRYWSLITQAAQGIGWILALALVVVPLVVAVAILPRAVDEEQFLPYHVGALFFFAGLFALSQLSALSPLWFWTWQTQPPMVSSEPLLCAFMLMAAATTVFALAVVGVDAFCRNHSRLAQQLYGEYQADEDATARMVDRSAFVRLVRRTAVVLVPFVLIACTVPGRYQKTARTMMGIAWDCIRETVRECGDAKWLFTDGACGTALELVSAATGGSLRTMDLVSSSSARDTYVRTRDAADREERLAAEAGVPALLRTWLKNRPERMKGVAVQLGFGLWRREGLAIPNASGFVARPAGFPEGEVARGVAAARSIAERMLSLYSSGGPSASAGAKLNDLFLFAQWRLARMARVRAEELDAAGRPAEALAEVELADSLDTRNPALKEILADAERANQIVQRQVTPREGLQMALLRADFALARRFAEPILAADPDDPDANFAMGMSYLGQNQYARAEEFLSRCLVRRPDEPAIWNNLAMTCLRTSRLAEAEDHARRALALAPASQEIRDTLAQILKASGKKQ